MAFLLRATEYSSEIPLGKLIEKNLFVLSYVRLIPTISASNSSWIHTWVKSLISSLTDTVLVLVFLCFFWLTLSKTNTVQVPNLSSLSFGKTGMQQRRTNCFSTSKFIKLCEETPWPCLFPFQGRKYGRRKSTETSVFEFFYLLVNSSLD